MISDGILETAVCIVVVVEVVVLIQRVNDKDRIKEEKRAIVLKKIEECRGKTDCKKRKNIHIRMMDESA